MTTDAPPPNYVLPTPLRVAMPSHSCEECDRCHALVPIWAWNSHAEWHLALAQSAALINAAVVLLGREPLNSLPLDVQAIVAWSVEYSAA
jgi:hypothetical protein